MDDFDRFWLAYPRRVKRKDAQIAWKKLAPSPELVTLMLTALDQQAVARARRMERGLWVPELPYPASWLRGERWTDEIEPTPAPRMTLANTRHQDQAQKTRQVNELIAQGVDRQEAIRRVYR